MFRDQRQRFYHPEEHGLRMTFTVVRPAVMRKTLFSKFDPRHQDSLVAPQYQIAPRQGVSSWHYGSLILLF